MAAWARGVRMASTVMCSAMGPCSGCSACTVTMVSGGASFLQPGRSSIGSMIAAASRQRALSAAGGKTGWRLAVVLRSRSVVIGSHRSRESLEIGQRGLIAHATIFAGIFGAKESGLGVDHFEHRGLAVGVAQLGEAQALFRGGYAGVERIELVAGRGGFGIGFIEARNQAPLRGTERHLGGIAANLALLDLVLGGKPVPDRNVESDPSPGAAGNSTADCKRRKRRPAHAPPGR